MPRATRSLCFSLWCRVAPPDYKRGIRNVPRCCAWGETPAGWPFRCPIVFSFSFLCFCTVLCEVHSGVEQHSSNDVSLEIGPWGRGAHLSPDNRRTTSHLSPSRPGITSRWKWRRERKQQLRGLSRGDACPRALKMAGAISMGFGWLGRRQRQHRDHRLVQRASLPSGVLACAHRTARISRDLICLSSVLRGEALGQCSVQSRRECFADTARRRRSSTRDPHSPLRTCYAGPELRTPASMARACGRRAVGVVILNKEMLSTASPDGRA